MVGLWGVLVNILLPLYIRSMAEPIKLFQADTFSRSKLDFYGD